MTKGYLLEEQPHWLTQFPSFPIDDMPPLDPEAWEDRSWCNDAGPNFYNASLKAWLFVLPRDRDAWPWDDPDVAATPRLTVYRDDLVDNAPLSDLAPMIEGEEWTDVAAALVDPQTERRWLCDRWTKRLGVGWHPDTRGEDIEALTPQEQAMYDADMERLSVIAIDPYCEGLAAMQRAGLIP